MAEHFFPVYDWMTEELHLGGNDLLAFAVIHSFTESGRRFDGSLTYLAERTGVCRQTACDILKRLTEKKLIAKEERFEGGLKYCRYHTVCRAAREQSGLVQDETEPFQKSEPSVRETRTEPFQNPEPSVRETRTNHKEYHKEYHKEEHKESVKGDGGAGAAVAPPVSKTVCGEYRNVLLTEEELETLRREYPADWRDRVERLSAYMASTGKRYRNHLATIRNWALRDAKEAKDKAPQPKQYRPIPGEIVL